MGNRMDPIRDKEKIGAIKDMLRSGGRWRDYVLFVCGINFGLRIGDLLRIQIKDVVDLENKIKDNLEIIEQKTGKRNIVKINRGAKDALSLLINRTNITANRNNYLIYNLRNKSKSISRIQAYKLVRKWCYNVGLTELAVGTHTLRKTWGYHAHKQGISIEVIQAKYKHSSTSTTRHYLGIEQKDVNEAYDKVNL
ncbi:tyrosine-type recombinase/integrase [Halonatronum saccharophilum]|uniref:tyrosine-type recombinase/integrase n=1 Tax=Halonatronum saccharophilum TaxID=150060 RepID=UPI00047F085A|nr:tyrosine-type recombinase/integrase [Halonatronum saccharophilum]